MWQSLKNRINRITNKVEYHTIKNKLSWGFGSLLAFIVVIILVNLVSLLLIRSNTNEIIEQLEPTVFAALELESEIKSASSSLGFYLVGHEAIHKKDHIDATNKIGEILNSLKQKETIQQDNDAQMILSKIQTNLQKFKEHQLTILELATNNLKNIPGILYATQNLNPISQQILQNLSSMLQTEADEEANKKRKQFLLDIEQLRYNWVNVMSYTRAYLAYRTEKSQSDINIFQEQVISDIKKLKKYKNYLTLDQLDSLKQINTLSEKFSLNLQELFKIHSSEKWRLDAYLIRKEVGPLLANTNKEIKNLINLQRHKIDTANNYLVGMLATIMLISLILLGIGIIIARRISVKLIRDIVKPLQAAVVATKNITAGDLTVSLDQTTQDEIGQLGHAFNNMVQKFQDDIEIERQTTEDVHGKVELISEVVEKAAQGDLTGVIMVYRDQDGISDLASGIKVMLENLNYLIAQVQQSGIQVTSSSTEIAATAKQQEATVSEQAASANQISTTAAEISATVNELVKTMDDVTSIVEATANEAVNSQSALANMEQTMHQMMNATSSIGAKLSVLSEKAANINSVVTTITKVADQTNLLSLNAAIEAEKAGEYGVGFAVVATEIRRLADQTAVATWDIEQMVKEMQSAVSAGVMGMDKFSDEVRSGVNDVREVSVQIAAIIEQVQALLPSFEAVHSGMQNQAQGAQQITESISQLSDGTQQTAESLRQSSNSISQLHMAAKALQDGVSKFKVKND